MIATSLLRAQRGVALIAVLWLVAAMSLIVTGVVQSVRGEIRTAGQQRQIVVASALADAAILLALQHLHASQKEPLNTVQLIPVQFQGTVTQVKVQPLNALIDINNAGLLLLADMYRYAGGLSAEAALTIAQATIDTRQAKSAKGTLQGFDSVEDLLKVPTMTYGLYAKISGIVVADLKDGTGRINAQAAPLEVLQVLTSGDIIRAAAMSAQRGADPIGMDTSFLKPEIIETASSRSLRVQVETALSSGGSFRKAWHVYWGTDPRSGLPWRMLGSYQSQQRTEQFGN